MQLGDGRHRFSWTLLNFARIILVPVVVVVWSPSSTPQSDCAWTMVPWRRTAWLDAAQPNRERRGPGTCVPRAPLGRSALRIERSRDRACTASTAWIRSCARLARHPMEMERLWRGHSHALPALSQRTIHTLSLIHQHMRHPNTAETCPREDPVGIVIRDGAPAL